MSEGKRFACADPPYLGRAVKPAPIDAETEARGGEWFGLAEFVSEFA